MNYNFFAETDIQPSPTPGISTLEDCADGCSSHPLCKAFVFVYGINCHFKTRDDIPLAPLEDCISGAINTCYYTNIQENGQAGGSEQGLTPASGPEGGEEQGITPANGPEGSDQQGLTPASGPGV